MAIHGARFATTSLRYGNQKEAAWCAPKSFSSPLRRGRLAGHVLQKLLEHSTSPSYSGGTLVCQHENQPRSDDEAQEVGRVWYTVAAAESQIAADIVL